MSKTVFWKLRNALKVFVIQYIIMTCSISIAEKIEQSIRKMKLEKEVDVTTTPQGVVLRITGHLFFNSGTAELKPLAFPILIKISDMLMGFSGLKMTIEGHTDNVDIHTQEYTSN